MKQIFFTLFVLIVLNLNTAIAEEDYRSGWTMTASHNSGSCELAFDGDINTRWNSGPQNGLEWIILDMQEPQVFNMILMDQNNGGDYPRQYTVYVSNDSDDFGEPVLSGEGTGRSTRIDFETDQTARYIKITQSGTSGGIYWSINELHVKKTDYRYGWTATAFNRETGGMPEIFDCNIETGWSTEAVQEPGQWVIVDMQQAHLFNQVVLEINPSHGGDYPRGYELYVTDDLENWKQALVEGVGTEGQKTTINIYFSQAARYIKVVQTATSGGYWAIEEFHANQVEDTDYRFGWTMTASNNNEKTAFALDNDSDTRWDSGPQLGAEWIIVDMKMVQTFNRISIEGKGDYPRKYEVYASNDVNEFGESIATGEGTDDVTLISFATQKARYIKIAQTGISGGTYWSINEFNIDYDIEQAIPTFNEDSRLVYYTEGQLNISENLIHSQIKIYNISGQLIESVINSGNIFPIHLNQGIYIVTVENENGSYRLKISVN